ncbi:MAG: helix-turn-helix transcriptional regulator [Clostridia bacterium]|nr:helix-turn-helix transcriptional regulator [Clostridia bacterium]MBR3975908.1 helix-turn-helix transcriptional regulator [Clostridia bacterium]
MISFSPFYETLKRKNISTYKLINQYGLSRSLLDRIKHNKPMTTSTLNDLCIILDCDISDIVEFKKDSTETI